MPADQPGGCPHPGVLVADGRVAPPMASSAPTEYATARCSSGTAPGARAPRQSAPCPRPCGRVATKVPDMHEVPPDVPPELAGHPDRIRWNARYETGAGGSFRPHPLVTLAFSVPL